MRPFAHKKKNGKVEKSERREKERPSEQAMWQEKEEHRLFSFSSNTGLVLIWGHQKSREQIRSPLMEAATCLFHRGNLFSSRFESSREHRECISTESPLKYHLIFQMFQLPATEVRKAFIFVYCYAFPRSPSHPNSSPLCLSFSRSFLAYKIKYVPLSDAST